MHPDKRTRMRSPFGKTAAKPLMNPSAPDSQAIALSRRGHQHTPSHENVNSPYANGSVTHKGALLQPLGPRYRKGNDEKLRRVVPPSSSYLFRAAALFLLRRERLPFMT